MSESISIGQGTPCRQADGDVLLCFIAEGLEIGNSYYVSFRCEDATGSCECCNSQFDEYYLDLVEAKSDRWVGCRSIPAAAWAGCAGCGCCKVVMYLNQGEIGGGQMKASVDVTIPPFLTPCQPQPGPPTGPQAAQTKQKRKRRGKKQ